MNKQIFFSIVIPTYNCADFLRRALDSVEAQSYSNYEVIVVDNHSCDHTSEVVDSFSHLQIRHVQIDNHGVIAASRNVGINMAQGEWIAFLDSDDTWYPKKLEQVKEAIAKDTDIILVCHDERLVDHGSPGAVLHYGSNSPNMYERLLFEGNALSPSAVTVKRATLLASRGFSEAKDFVTAEDYEYWIRLAQMGKFCFLKEVLGEYHLHGKNESSKVEKNALALIAVVSYHLDALDVVKYGNRIRKRRSSVWCTAGRMLLQAGLFNKALAFCWAGLKHWPLTIKGYIVIFLAACRIKL